MFKCHKKVCHIEIVFPIIFCIFLLRIMVLINIFVYNHLFYFVTLTRICLSLEFVKTMLTSKALHCQNVLNRSWMVTFGAKGMQYDLRSLMAYLFAESVIFLSLAEWSQKNGIKIAEEIGKYTFLYSESRLANYVPNFISSNPNFLLWPSHNSIKSPPHIPMYCAPFLNSPKQSPTRTIPRNVN